MSVLNKLRCSYHGAIQSILLYIHFAIALKHFKVLYSWNFFSYSAHSHWLLRGHIASNNELNCFPPKSLSGQRCKIYDVRVNSALLLANVDRRLLLQRGLKNVFQLQHFQPYNRSLKNCSLEKQ